MHVAAYDVVRANAPYRAALAAATEAVMDSGQLVLGERLGRFEQDFAAQCGTSDCVGVGNGLDALTLALRALGIREGDEVIVPAFTFVATWFAVAAVGARPVAVDVRDDGMIDPTLIPAAITARTRAIVPVHLFGALADMDVILAMADHFALAVVEDAAQAHGAACGSRRAGSFGTAAAFSFYPTKNLGALGDGGAVCTGDPALAARVRCLRNYGSEDKYHHREHGWNSRLDTLQAAYLAVKLPHLDVANARRQAIAGRYGAALADIPGLVLPSPTAGSVWHQYVVRSPARTRLQQALAGQGVGTTIHYPVAPFDQPCFAGHYDRDRYPVAMRLAATVLSLPMADYLTEAEIDHVIQATIAAVHRHGG